MTDIQRAMLGDHDAAARLTEQGVLIPCPFCDNDDDMKFTLSFRKDRKKRYSTYYDICKIYCECCTASIQRTGVGKDRAAKNATNAWNTRAPLLTPEQIDMLERMESEE